MQPYNISIFKNVTDNTPYDLSLDKWLKYTINPPEKWLKLYENYQKTLSDEDKKKLPAATISARFSGWRDEQHLVEKMPFICLDIDRHSKNNKKPSNDCVDMQLTKEFFMTHPSCYYCGFSCSGDGVYVVMYIYEPNRLIDYFEYFKSKLSKRGLNIDESCKDYSRLRFFSVDAEAYLNTNAKPLKISKTENEVKKPKRILKKSTNFSGDIEQQKTEKIIDSIQRNSIDITSIYDDWIKIAGALNNEFGEAGRSYFHSVSQYHSDYDYKKCDRKFDQCKKMNQTSIASFYKIALNYGISYKS